MYLFILVIKKPSDFVEGFFIFLTGGRWKEKMADPDPSGKSRYRASFCRVYWIQHLRRILSDRGVEDD